MALKENYKDDILDTSQNVKRKYQMENNGDGTVSFTDVTEYTQQGDSFGSGAINPIAHAINGLNNYTFNPSGSIDLVALIADDSYYLNEDNKYVLADSPTGQALINSDPTTYKALASDTDLYGIEGEDTVSGFEPSCTPITVGGETLSTIDDKLNYLVGNIVPVLDREICNAFVVGSGYRGACVRETDGTVLNGASSGSTVTTEDFIMQNINTIKANKTGKYLIFGSVLDGVYSPTASIVDANANDILINLQPEVHTPNSVVIIIRLD